MRIGCVYRTRDRLLKALARRKGLVVPSLLADRMSASDDAQIRLLPSEVDERETGFVADAARLVQRGGA